MMRNTKPCPSAQNLQRTSDTQHMVVCKEEVSTEQERSPSLVKEEPESPHIKEEPDGSMLLAVKSEDDDEISSHCSEVEIEVELDSDTEVTEDSDEWEETSGGDASYSAVALNSHAAKSQHPQTSRAQEHPPQRDEPSIFLLVGVVPASTNGVGSQSAQTQVFSCSECSYAFTSQVFLYRHMKRNHNDLYCQMLRNGQITSAACQQIISSVTTSQQQGDTDEPRSYSHQQFTKTLSQPGGVKTYTDSVNRTGKKPHICKHCGKGFRRLSNLKTHKHVHTGEKLFHCKQCDKSFSWSGDLNRHRLVHTRAKPFHCKHCDKSFNEAGCLKKHQRVHTGERPFHCTRCDKRFKLSGHLKSHQLIHTGERPFHCKLCDKSFGHSSGLSRHLRIHTGEKPFQCKHCDKRFIETGALKTHQRVHAANKNLSTVNAVADCQ